MRTLLDSCCTGAGLVHSNVIKDLGMCMEDTGTRGSTYTSVGGTFRSQGRVKVPSVMFPVFSGDRTFNLELEVVPTRGHMTYGMILGQDTMRKLEIDTIVSRNIFVSKDIERPMVERDYWSKERIKGMEPVWKKYLDKLNVEEKSIADDGSNIPELFE